MLAISSVKKLLRNTPGTFGVYIKDLSTNTILVDINSSTHFPSASVVKVFVAGYIQHLLDNGELSLSDKIVHKPEHTLQGSGFFKYLESGREYSVLELLKLMLIESDNTASKMLINTVGANNINTYLKSFEFLSVSGPKVENDQFVGWGITTPLEVAKFLQFLLQKECITKEIMKDKDATDSIGYHLQKPYENNIIAIYSKTGSLHPRVKNVVALIENTQNADKLLVAYFSKDLSEVRGSIEIIKALSKEISDYLGLKS